MNGGPQFKFNEAISLVVNCKKNQEEIDEYWAKLTNGGEESQCGWLKDRYGVVMAGRAGRAGRDDRRQGPGAERGRHGGLDAH